MTKGEAGGERESRGELVDFRMVLGSVASGKMRGVHARLFGGGEMGAA